MDEEGRRLAEARIEANSAEGFEAFFKSLGGGSKVVLEASWNWSALFERLERIEGIEEIVLAHPYKTRLIADSQIKTDRIDARALATLLRGNFVARAHIPSRAARLRKEELRQRAYWVRIRTRLHNRMHVLLGRVPQVQMPQVTDLFGKKGLEALHRAELSEPYATMLKQDLKVHDLLQEQIRSMEKAIVQKNGQDAATQLLMSLPGVGKTIAAVIASEIDSIDRFKSSAKLCSYAGLVPTTHASGGKVYHGRLVSGCNKWLRWALVEAAWVSIGCSAYFGSIYKQHRARGKPANIAITIVARRLCQIVWNMLKENRPFRQQVYPSCSGHALTAA